MYSWETLVLLRHLLDQGLGKTAIAEQTGVSRGLIRDAFCVARSSSTAPDPPLYLGAGR